MKSAAWQVGAGMDSARAADQIIDGDLARLMADVDECDELPERAKLGSQNDRACAAPCPRGERTSGEVARLAPGTRALVRRFRPGRRARTINAALGSAIFATMSIGSLAILGPPHGYIFAAGMAALAVLLPMRELRGNV